jgi:hypothetical protein
LLGASGGVAPRALYAETRTAAALTSEAVWEAIDAAKDGDTVELPAGTAVWTRGWNTGHWAKMKAITIQGAGIDKTIIRDSTSRAAGDEPFEIKGVEGKPFRITGITFDGTGLPDAGVWAGGLVISGNCKNFRVDHCKFLNMDRMITISGDTYGLVDHCYFHALKKNRLAQTIMCMGPGKVNLTKPLTLGTAQAVYFEDNEVIFSPEVVNPTGNNPWIVPYDGAQVVIRHNKVINSQLEIYRVRPGAYGCRSAEIYDNVFSAEGARMGRPQGFIMISGGVAIVFNNTVTGTTYNCRTIELMHDRAFTAIGEFGVCDGTNPLDGNQIPAGQKGAGYPAIGQPGGATDLDGKGVFTPTPCYAWNNTLNGAKLNMTLRRWQDPKQTERQAEIVEEGRDFFNEEPPEGYYTPCVYPHPLQEGWEELMKSAASGASADPGQLLGCLRGLNWAINGHIRSFVPELPWRAIMRLLRYACVIACSLVIVAGLFPARAAAAPVPTSLTADAATVGLWRFQEGEGETSVCEAKGPAATLHGATWVPGRDGFAVATRGGYVSIPDAPQLRPKDGLTVEAWVKLGRLGGDLICKNGGYQLRIDAALRLSLHIDGKWRVLSGRRAVPTGRWTHLAATYDAATKTAAIYLDGALDVKEEIKDLTTGQMDQSTAELRLGANDWSPLSSAVDGKVDSVRVSNVARTFEPPAAVHEAAAPKGNLVPNGDFELSLLGWRLYGEGDTNLAWGTTTQDPASGRRCLHSLPDSEVKLDLLSRPIPVSPATHYTFSVWMKADAKRTARVAIEGFGVNGGPIALPPFPLYPTLNTTWTQVSESFTLPADCAAPSLCIRFQNPGSGQVWVDDVRLVVGDGTEAAIIQDKIAVGPKTAPVGNLYFAGELTPLVLNVVNTDSQAHEVAVRAYVIDWEHVQSPAATVGTLEVPAGGVKGITYPLDTGRRGTFRLGFELSADGQSWRQSTDFKYAVVVPLKGIGDADASIFGMNTHMDREPTPHLQRNMEVLSQCGVKWIRAWWGWGMCEKTLGQFDWTEYERQFAAVTEAKMRVMPVLLRYYPQLEQAWAGSLATVQQPPAPDMMDEWGEFAGQVARHFAGEVGVYEIWNEPPTDNKGAIPPEIYAQIVKEASPAIRWSYPEATIVGFAGVHLPYMKRTLELDTGSLMDVVSEHSYGQVNAPEVNLPARMKEVRELLRAAGAEKPIWHTEQGIMADDDGYRACMMSEAESASLYTRNLVTCGALGVGKYFWFSAQTSPTYGASVFYENYIPRSPLVALNACASFTEGLKYQKSVNPDTATYAHLYRGASAVCVAWNINAPMLLSLPLPSDKVKAFDTMGNAVQVVSEKDRAVVEFPVDRPIYLQCPGDDYTLLEKALEDAEVEYVDPVVVTSNASSRGIEVKVTSRSRTAHDGVVDLVSAEEKKPAGWPMAQHFQSLGSGESKSFTFAMPDKTAVREVRVRVGDRQMQEVKVPVTEG